METAIQLILLSTVASFIQRTTGFGFGIFIMTMLVYLVPSYGEATTLSGILALTTSAYVMLKTYKLIDWKKILPILLVFTIVSTGCIFIVKHLETKPLLIALGIILIATSLFMMLFSEKINFHDTARTRIGVGTIGGVLGGFFGMQGPPIVLYFIKNSEDNDHYIANTQCIFALGNLLMTGVRAFNGFFTATVAQDYLFGIIGVLIGTNIGSIVYKHIPCRILKYIVYAYIGVSGIIVLVSHS